MYLKFVLIVLLNDRLNDEYISVFCGQDRFVTLILTIISGIYDCWLRCHQRCIVISIILIV